MIMPADPDSYFAFCQSEQHLFILLLITTVWLGAIGFVG